MLTSNRRRRYWINPAFQLRYLITIFMLEMIAVVAAALVAFTLAFILLSDDLTMGPQWSQILAGFVVLILVIAGLFIYLGVRITHRIVGPIYRIKQTLAAVRRGERPGPIKLRDHDHLQDLAAALNETFETIGHPLSPAAQTLRTTGRTTTRPHER